MAKKKQKFFHGDVVKVAKDLGSSMRHFPNDCLAIVIDSYDDAYGGGDTDSYGLLILKAGDEVSWYKGNQLTKISEVSPQEVREIKERFDHD